MSHSDFLKNTYFNWLFEEYKFNQIDQNVIEIQTPFLDNESDSIILYSEFLSSNQVLLTDDGWTLNFLKHHGISFSGSTQKNILNTIVTPLGTKVKEDELCITTSIDQFPIAKQRLLQTIMQVNDMIVLQNKQVKNVFQEEVRILLDKQKILFTNRPSFTGKEGITVQFDFAIPTNKIERLVRTISNGNDLNRAKLLAMDTRILQYNRTNTEYIALVDDLHYEFTKDLETKAIFQENSHSQIHLIRHSQILEDYSLLSNKV
ncbi:DUF1828 domain-containing protein [Streptococcus sp. 121]|uniref:DUF1828 domain-containing protein n=1 Tax=Streptococcus sp. 121 TaxID=2797637 RepID=UPI0018F0A6D0|nr:DUF1828 domain-containing protein [Streptococcus sp. 121]MBJ6746250.1 DUF1828 domain-containing protein [Streptococcus sp. 121]